MVRTSPVLLLLLAVCAPLATGDLFGYKSLTDIARDLSPVEAGLYSYLHKCRLREHPEVALAQAFADKFVGQSDAIKAIVAAVKDWSDDVAAGRPHPLVMGFKGSTGVGKTEAAYLVAEAVLGATQSSGGGLTRPKGLTLLRGEDYAGPVNESYAILKQALMRDVGYCDGNGVIIFDEVQQANPLALNALAPAFELKGASLTEGTTRVDFSRVVFIIISDVGTEPLKQMVAEFDVIDVSVIHQLGNQLKHIMSEHWVDTNIAGKFTAVIPFLPYTPDDALALLASGVSVLNKEDALYFSSYGARDIFNLNSGPLKRLKKAVLEVASEVDEKGGLPAKLQALTVEATDTLGQFQFWLCATTDEFSAGKCALHSKRIL